MARPESTQRLLDSGKAKEHCTKGDFEDAHVIYVGVLNRLAAQVAEELRLLDESELEERRARENLELVSRVEELRQRYRAAQRHLEKIQDVGRQLFRNLDDAEECEVDFREKAGEAGYDV